MSRIAISLLTPKEREVMNYSSMGYTNAEVASIMLLSEKTVKNHITGIHKKTGTLDRQEWAKMLREF